MSTATPVAAAKPVAATPVANGVKPTTTTAAAAPVANGVKPAVAATATTNGTTPAPAKPATNGISPALVTATTGATTGPTLKPSATQAAKTEPAAVVNGAPPVVNLAVKSSIVPANRKQRQSIIAGGVARTENLVDLSAAKKNKDGAAGGDSKDEPPNFFVLVSETSLFAGVPNVSGAIDGPANISKFNTPCDIVVDRNQQLFIADTDNARIRRISKQGQVSTVAAIGGGDGDIENFPHGLAFDQKGAMYILQSGLKHQIFQVAPGQGVKLLAGSDEIGHKDSNDLLQASFNIPRATGVDSQNRIYICDKGNNAVRRIDLEKQTVITLLGPGGTPLDLLNPEGLVVDQYDDVFIADTGHHRILKVSFYLDEQTDQEETTVSNYCGKYGVASYANGPAATSLLNSPTGLAIDKQNHLWICDSGNNCIRMMAHGAELLFTISGKGSSAQEKQYNYPTSIALSYDAMYGAQMSDICPEVVRNDPNHPLYYSYITPVIFVADSGSHCIRKIHTLMFEAAKALIDVCTPAPVAALPGGAEGENTNDYPMHNALAYPITNQRNKLMQVLLQLKPQLLQQKDLKGRIPLHIACMESKTDTAGTISMDIINRMLGMAQPNAVAAIMCEDKEGKIPVAYALQQIIEHTMNIASAKLEQGDDYEPDSDNPDLPWDASRQLLNAMLSLAPQALQHPSCKHVTLHTLIAAGVPLKFLKKFAQAIEDARDMYEADGMLESTFTTMFELKASALAKYPNPFFVRDEQSGKLPIHVAAAMHAEGTPVNIDVLQWLVLESQLPPQTKGALQTVRTRDWSLKASLTGKKTEGEVVEGHHAMFYACTLPRAPPPNAPPGPQPQLHKPLHKIPKEQVIAIEYLLDAWPESILQNEAAGVLHSSPFQATSMKPASFLEWVFYHRALELLEIFCRRMPGCLDRFVWLDTQDVITLKDSEASAIGKDGRKKRRNSVGPNTLTMLHSAAKIGDAELLEILLKHNANPFVNDKRDKLCIDYAEDEKCKALIETYMNKDPRKPIAQTVTLEISTQTEGDSAEEEKKKQEAVAKALAEKEAEIKALLEKERAKAEEEAKARQAELAAKQAELEATQAKLLAEAAAQKAQLQAEAEAEKAKLQAEAESEKARLLAEAAAEKEKLATAVAAAEAAEAAAKAKKEHEWMLMQEAAAAAELEKDAARQALEKKLQEDAAAEKAKLAAEKQKLLDEMEAERNRIAHEAEQEKIRVAQVLEQERQRLATIEQEKDAARATAEQTLKAELAAEKAKLQQEAAAEKQRLAEAEAAREAARVKLEAEMKAAEEKRQAELKKNMENMSQADQEREAARKKLEADLHAAMEAEKAKLKAEAEAEKARLAKLEAERLAAAEAEKQRLAAEAEAEKQRLAKAEAEKDAARQALEKKLAEEAAAEKARLAKEKAALLEEMEAERNRLAHEAEQEKIRVAQVLEQERQRLATIEQEKDAARLQAEQKLKAEMEAEKARLQAEAAAEHQRQLEAEAAREAARRKLEADLKAAADKEAQRLADERAAEKLRLAAQDAEREAKRLAAEAAAKAAEEEAEERERLRALKNAKLTEQRDASRAAAEAAELAKKIAIEEMARLKEALEAAQREKAASDAAAAAAEAARIAAEADAEEARRRREHQWNLNAEHEERLRKEQEAAIANRPLSAKGKDLGDLKRVPQPKKQSAAELAALARAQAAIDAAAARRNAPKKILGFGSSALKDEVSAIPAIKK